MEPELELMFALLMHMCARYALRHEQRVERPLPFFRGENDPLEGLPADGRAALWFPPERTEALLTAAQAQHMCDSIDACHGPEELV